MSVHAPSFRRGYLAAVRDMSGPGATARAIVETPDVAAAHALQDPRWSAELDTTGEVTLPPPPHHPADGDPSGAVYLARDQWGRVKIGQTTIGVHARLRQIECASGTTLTLLAAYPGGRPLELALHEKFSDLRLNGEWFQGDQRIDDWIRSWQK